MKQCPTCQEEFADKFGFCPVDGTPLDAAVAEPVVMAKAADESVVTAPSPAATAPDSSNGYSPNEAAASAHPHVERGLYHLTMIEDEGLTRRLVKEVKGAAHEA